MRIEFSSPPATMNHQRFDLGSVPIKARRRRLAQHEGNSHLQLGFFAPEKRRRRGSGPVSNKIIVFAPWIMNIRSDSSRGL
jgi:hypothetical protein